MNNNLISIIITLPQHTVSQKPYNQNQPSTNIFWLRKKGWKWWTIKNGGDIFPLRLSLFTCIFHSVYSHIIGGHTQYICLTQWRWWWLPDRILCSRVQIFVCWEKSTHEKNCMFFFFFHFSGALSTCSFFKEKQISFSSFAFFSSGVLVQDRKKWWWCCSCCSTHDLHFSSFFSFSKGLNVYKESRAAEKGHYQKIFSKKSV